VDPELAQLIEEGAPEDLVAVIVRVHDPRDLPSSVDVVASFGEIFTGRIRRDEVVPARAHRGVASVKAAEILVPEEPLAVLELDAEVEEAARLGDVRRPEGVPETGRGVVVGVVDWG
jgi:hypothetical protein